LKDEIKQNKVKISELKTEEDIKENCMRKSSKGCIIGLFDGKDDIVMLKHAQLLKDQGHYLNLDEYQFFYLDASCHYEILMQLDISPEFLPTVISYNHQTRR